MGEKGDDSFPRGGKRVAANAEIVKRKFEERLFPAGKAPKSKKARKEKKSPVEASTELWQSSLKLQGTLSYRTLQDGMIILGCIRNITNLAMQIELPGLTFAQITVNRISDAFTQTLTQKLQNAESDGPGSEIKSIFQIGRLLPAKIVSVGTNEKNNGVQASINPKDINAEKKHNSFTKGLTIWASVVSELDHGYEMTVGVNNCRVFLPFKNIDNGKKYAVGEPLFCVVHKVEDSSVATTITVSAKKGHLDTLNDTDGVVLNNITPGMQVEFTITENFAHGVKGTFLENYFGFIDQSNFFGTKPQTLKEYSVVRACILFTDPMTKVTHLSLRGLDDVAAPTLELGKVISSEVASASPRGLYLKLAKKNTGFVTHKRLVSALSKDALSDLSEAVKRKYPVGSHHTCRILDYNRMQQTYICTFEQRLLKEPIFTVNDLVVGQSVKARVDKVIPTGLTVSVGHVQGFVPNLHLSNSQFSETVKGKYFEGMAVNARVLNVTDEGNTIFTLKQGLVESDRCLVDLEGAVLDSQFVGFVVQAKLSGALVAFYGSAKGWISNRELNAGQTGTYSDPREYFFRGQVVNVWILGLKNEKLQVSLIDPETRKKKQIKNNTNESKDLDIASKKEKKNKQEKKTIEKTNEVQVKKTKKNAKRKAEEEIIEVVSVETIKKKSKKRKAVEKVEEIEEVEVAVVPKKKAKKTKTKVVEEKPVKSTVVPLAPTEHAPLLSGVKSFFGRDALELKEESSSDEETQVDSQKKKKKKLTAAERAELARQEEERIIKIEKELADATTAPQSVDQFDRLLLANPNSSELWLKYMAMHVATTELEKARAVGKRALDTINMTLIKEKFNIWIALLNLENLYGTKESFEKLFEDAVKFNDSLEIYLSVIKMLASSGKLSELEEKIKKVRGKEKQNSKMWLEVGQVYYNLGILREARNIKEAALRSILDKKRQFDLIVKFGIMEFHSGELEQAIANFEAIINTYPGKTQIWTIYADQLVKKGEMELARMLLQRAISQEFPLKNMKILFQKFIKFEEQHGTAESVEEVKKKAKDYVKSVKVR